MGKTVGEFRVGAVITAFNIGPVLTDTINSVLAQRDVTLTSVLVVVDGCGYSRTTRDICTRYARALSDLVRFVWLENGGVSRARNVGVKWTLENRPDTDGVYLIDGDDLVDPLVVSRCVEKLLDAKREAPERRIGWTYSNQSQFGDDSPFTEYPQGFIPTRWLSNNLSQPSCLIDRSMFDAGVFWDEDMRRGIEDWEYWLSAIENGFEGTPAGNTHLRYRRLTGNRSSLNRANDLITKEYMREKHAVLYTVERYLEDESRYFPRWAFMTPAIDYAFELRTDPALTGETVDRTRFLDVLSKRLSLGPAAPVIVHPYFPDMVAFVDAADAEALHRLKRCHGTLLGIERLLDTNGLVTLRLNESRSSDDACGFLQRESAGDAASEFTSFFLSLRKLAAILDAGDDALDAGTALTRLLRTGHRHLVVDVPLSRNSESIAPPFERAAPWRLEQIVGDVVRVAKLPKSVCHLHRPRHTVCGAHCAEHKALSTTVTGLWPLLPKRREKDRTVVGALLSDANAAQVSAALDTLGKHPRAADIDVELVFVSAAGTAAGFATHPLVRSIAVVEGDPAEGIPSSRGGYLGLPHYERLPDATRDHLAGLLAGSTVLLDFHGPELAAVSLALKPKGVECVLVIDDAVSPVHERRAGGEVGGITPYWMDPVALQAYNGAYRRFLAADDAVRTTLSSYGVAMSKFITGYADAIGDEETDAPAAAAASDLGAESRSAAKAA